MEILDVGGLAVLSLVIGTILAWGGPLDPEYAEDWCKFALGMFLAGWGLWYLTVLVFPV
jgi:hypothetical protein